MTRVNTAHRKNERGITIVLVAFSLLSLLGMAALAIDVSTLYMAHGEAQRAADAAALAGARMFAFSGYTSASSTLTAADICQTSAVPGAAGGGQPASGSGGGAKPGRRTACGGAIHHVHSHGRESANCGDGAADCLADFLWTDLGGATNSVTATAVAEAYNPSGIGGADADEGGETVADTELRPDQWRSGRLRGRASLC